MVTIFLSLVVVFTLKKSLMSWLVGGDRDLVRSPRGDLLRSLIFSPLLRIGDFFLFLPKKVGTSSSEELVHAAEFFRIGESGPSAWS